MINFQLETISSGHSITTEIVELLGLICILNELLEDIGITVAKAQTLVAEGKRSSLSYSKTLKKIFN